MLYNELPIVFPWYEKIEQQNRYRENTGGICDYKLISPRNALLPFQFVKSTAGLMPNLWEVYEINSNVKVADISNSIPFLRVRLIEGQEYFTYSGQELTTGINGPLSLPAGYYYSRLSWPDGVLRFSEMFHVPDEGAFNISDDDNTDFLKIEYWNDNDLRPVFYNDKQTNGRPYFRNVMYLESFITASEPEIQEDGVRDGNDELILTFQKVIIRYRITAAVPDFLKKALVMIEVNDHVWITSPHGIRSGEIDKANVSSALEASGALSIVDIVFQETVLIKKGCGENMAFNCSGSAPGLNNPIIISGSNYVLSGTAPAGSLIQIYRLNSPVAVPTDEVGILYDNVQFAAGISIPITEFFGSTYVVVRAFKFGCDFGFSNVVPKPS